MSKPVSSYPFLSDLKPLQNTLIVNAKRTKIRDAIRRHPERKFTTSQIGDDVLVTRIK